MSYLLKLQVTVYSNSRQQAINSVTSALDEISSYTDILDIQPICDEEIPFKEPKVSWEYSNYPGHPV